MDQTKKLFLDTVYTDTKTKAMKQIEEKISKDFLEKMEVLIRNDMITVDDLIEYVSEHEDMKKISLSNNEDIKTHVANVLKKIKKALGEDRSNISSSYKETYNKPACSCSN